MSLLLLFRPRSAGGTTYPFSLDGGSYTFTGGDVSFKVTRKFSLEGGTFTFSGQDVTFNYIPAPPATGGEYRITIRMRKGRM